MSAVIARLTRHRVLMPIALAVCAALLLMWSLSLDATRDEGSAPATGSHIAAPGVAADELQGRGDAATAAKSFTQPTALEASVAPTGLTTAPLSAPSLDTRIIRTASVQLTTKRGGFEDAWGDAQATAGAFGGIVTATSRSGSGAGARSATLTLRIPSNRFDAAVARLRKLDGVKVAALDVSSEDVSEEFVDTTSRLKHDRAVESRLLTLLAETKTVNEVLAVQARLDSVQEQIELSTGRLRYLDQMTSMSTINVTIRQPGVHASGQHQKGSVVGTALRDAGDRFLARISSAIVWVGGALPALLVLAMVVLAGRLMYRRRGARTTDSGA